MIFARWIKAFAPVLLSLMLFTSACSKAPSRYAEVQKETTGRGAQTAVVKASEQGSTFNKFFPDSAGAYDVVPAQEKKGFAEYKLNNRPRKILGYKTPNQMMQEEIQANTIVDKANSEITFGLLKSLKSYSEFDANIPQKN